MEIFETSMKFRTHFDDEFLSDNPNKCRVRLTFRKTHISWRKQANKYICTGYLMRLVYVRESVPTDQWTDGQTHPVKAMHNKVCGKR